MGSGYRNALVYPPPPHNRLGHFTVFINSMHTRCTYLYFKEPVSQNCKSLQETVPADHSAENAHFNHRLGTSIRQIPYRTVSSHTNGTYSTAMAVDPDSH